jgi:hypothetical protein
MLASLCIAACGKDPSGTGSSESSGSSSGAEESSTSSSTTVMTTSPPTTSMTTAMTTDESLDSSTGEPECTDPFGQGVLQRFAKLQLLEEAPAYFTDIGTILGDRYIVGAAAPGPDDPLAPTLFIVGMNTVDMALMNEADEDTIVDRLWIDAAGTGSRVFTQTLGSTVEVIDPGDFFNVVGTYQEMEAPTRIIDVVEADGALWGVGTATGMVEDRWLLARSDDLGASWTTQQTFELDADQPAVARAVGYHEGASALILAGTASDAEQISNWHTRVALLAEAADSEALDTVANGNARAIEIIGDSIVVAGDVEGIWRVRMAPSVGMPFDDLDDGTGFEQAKSSAVDLAQGPNGELFALGSADDDPEHGLLVLRMCADPTLGPACWTTLIEPFQAYVGEDNRPTRMMVDEDGVWMVGSIVDTDDHLGAEAYLFHFGCE